MTKIEQFPAMFTPQMCEDIINYVRPQMTIALVGQEPERWYSPARLADNFLFRNQTQWSEDLRVFTAKVTHSRLELVEKVEVIHYPMGGFFLCHHDGDWRSHTVIVSLNSNYMGGDLHFPKLGQLFTRIPTGMGLLWANDTTSHHAARTVLFGERWLAKVTVHRPAAATPARTMATQARACKMRPPAA